MITGRLNPMPIYFIDAPFTGAWQELCPAIPAPLAQLRFVNDSDTAVWISYKPEAPHDPQCYVAAGGDYDLYIEQFTPTEVQGAFPAGLPVYIMCANGAFGTKGRIVMISCSFYRR
jgi:hypothetical protein